MHEDCDRSNYDSYMSSSPFIYCSYISQTCTYAYTEKDEKYCLLDQDTYINQPGCIISYKVICKEKAAAK